MSVPMKSPKDYILNQVPEGGTTSHGKGRLVYIIDN